MWDQTDDNRTKISLSPESLAKLTKSKCPILPGMPVWSSDDNSKVVQTSWSTASEATSISKETDHRDFQQEGKATHENELYFRDGIRKIDMVLVFTEESPSSKQSEYRSIFERNLRKEGLELELEDKTNSSSGDIYFLKIHATWDVLTRYAEAINLKMPLKVDDDDEQTRSMANGKLGRGSQLFNIIFPASSVLSQNIETRTSFLTAPFIRARADNFAIDSSETFFIPSQRSMIVWHILCRTHYKNKRKEMVGINKLLKSGVYKACFPLHDSDIYSKTVPTPTRALLFQQWGSARLWYQQQPLPLIRDYFGDKVGLYFAWLGSYTAALIPAAVVGLLCFLYGAFTINSDSNIVSREICNETIAANLIMCPVCNTVCPYWKLGESCLYSKVSYLFDNYATCFFAIFMSIWATVFLESWKRRQAKLSWEWDLMETTYIDDEEIRPEFESRARVYRISPISKRREPFIPQSKRAVQYIVSGVGILFVCVCLIIAMLLIIIYRLVIITQFSKVSNHTIQHYAKFFASSSAALIHLLMITAFKPVGRKLAHVLTEYEAPRTQSDFEDNYTFKFFAFEFINVYSSLIYIAIFKGRFYVHPGDNEATASSFNIIRTDACDPSGCFFELCIQMAIIMVGRQVTNNFIEIVLPKIQIWRRNRNAFQAERERHSRDRLSRWEADYNLQPVDSLSFHEEYNEMVIQYGLVTLFVAAFPLAPFFALLNNIIEIRVDAYKVVTQFRRPVAQRVADIGVWMEILKALTYFAVVTNAFVIAFSSEFVPRLVHFYTNNFNLQGYLNFTLSVFNTSLYSNGMGPQPEADTANVTLCYYRAMRDPSNDPKDPHDLSMNYWYTFAARLLFVVAFEHVVIALTGILAYIIPDIPSSVREKLARERLLQREALVNHDDLESATGRHGPKTAHGGPKPTRDSPL